MALRQGEIYRCSNPECGCEIQVLKEARAGGGGEMAPTCCCGREMEKVK